MRKILIVCAAVAAPVALSPTGARAQAPPPPPPPVQIQPAFHAWEPWVLFGCTGSVVLSAMVANWKDNRQLTYWEAYTCGLLYWIPRAAAPPKPHKHHHKAAILSFEHKFG